MQGHGLDYRVAGKKPPLHLHGRADISIDIQLLFPPEQAEMAELQLRAQPLAAGSRTGNIENQVRRTTEPGRRGQLTHAVQEFGQPFQVDIHFYPGT